MTMVSRLSGGDQLRERRLRLKDVHGGHSASLSMSGQVWPDLFRNPHRITPANRRSPALRDANTWSGPMRYLQFFQGFSRGCKPMRKTVSAIAAAAAVAGTALTAARRWPSRPDRQVRRLPVPPDRCSDPPAARNQVVRVRPQPGQPGSDHRLHGKRHGDRRQAQDHRRLGLHHDRCCRPAATVRMSRFVPNPKTGEPEIVAVNEKWLRITSRAPTHRTTSTTEPVGDCYGKAVRLRCCRCGPGTIRSCHWLPRRRRRAAAHTAAGIPIPPTKPVVKFSTEQSRLVATVSGCPR